MRLWLACISALVFVALALPGAAAAKDPVHLRIWVASGIEDGGKMWQLQDGKVTVKGVMKPYVSGESVLVTVRQSGNKLVSYRANVNKTKHGKGRFKLSLPVKASGDNLYVRAKHQASDSLKKGQSNRVDFGAIYPSAAYGQSGQNVRLLQMGLLEQVSGERFSASWQVARFAGRNLL